MYVVMYIIRLGAFEVLGLKVGVLRVALGDTCSSDLDCALVCVV